MANTGKRPKPIIHQPGAQPDKGRTFFMTTHLKNGSYTRAVNVFRAKHPPDSALPLLFSMIDCVKETGPGWLRDDPAKAMLFPVLVLVYGDAFHLDSIAEYARLDKALPPNIAYRQEANYFRAPVVPANPLPFLNTLVSGIRTFGGNWLRTDEAKAILFPVLIMTYPTPFVLDRSVEFDRLNRVIPKS